MGAENSVLEGCEWGEEILAAELDWDLQHAELKDGRPITVFQPRKNERKYNDMIQQLAKSLKKLRHPSILRYIGAGKTSEGYFLVTEQATPLSMILDKLSPLELCSGLGDVLDALTFLHDKAGITHNNISVSAIFVSKDGSWKLGELQHACPFSAATAEFLDACRAFRSQEALPPEEKQNEVEVKGSQGHARDLYGLGVLCEQLSEQLSELGEFDKSFEEKIAACLSPDPAHRPRALELKNDCLFQNDFIQILNFVRNVALKTGDEKAEFFRDLLPRLQALPEELVARRLAIPLLSRFVLLEDSAVTHVVPHLLTPKSDPDDDTPAKQAATPLLSAELFRNYIIPELQRILLVHDAHIRLVLLWHFPGYVGLFDRDTLQNEVFPQILLGLRDSHDGIVASSLRALADLVPLLGGDVVIGGQRKTFFFQGMPKFLPMREKEKGPGNVGEVLLQGGKVQASNGKPLLKDLISGGVTVSSKDLEQERRRQDRERRREEARKKKEERQRKFRLLQAEMEMEEQNKLPRGSTDDSTDTVCGSDSTSKAGRKAEKETTLGVDSSDKPSDSGEEVMPESDSKGANRNTHIEEEKFASEESEEDWQDWEDKDSNSVKKSVDEIIGDEIEAELSQMSGKRLSRAEGKKIPTSPDPYTPSSPTEVSWSDSQVDSVVTSPSKPQTHRAEREEDSQEPAKKDTAGLISDKSSSSQQTSGKGLKLVAKNKTTTAAKTVPGKKTAVSEELGVGYDVKSIELSVAREEEDFFADMMPDIKPAADKGLTEEKTESRGKSEHTSGGPGLSLFAVMENTAEDSAGWGDDGDWGGEF